MRGGLLLLLALFIDALQGLLSMGFFVLGTTINAATPIGGAVGGAAAGAVICYQNAGGVIEGITDAAKCAAAGGALGAAGGTFGVAIGTGLGFVVSLCLSATLGVGLLILLKYNDMLYLKPVAFGGLAELFPGFSLVPGWTALTLSCIITKAAEEGTVGSGVFGSLVARAASRRSRRIAKVLASKNKLKVATAVMSRNTPEDVESEQEPGEFTSAAGVREAPSRDKTTLKEFDGIRRPVNDNARTKQAYAA